MKKKILLTAVVALVLSILTSGTLAYFTADDTARNVITSSGVDIDIEEWQQTNDGLQPYPKDVPIQIMPATTVSKIVTVKNHEGQSFVRAALTVTVMDATGGVMDLTDVQREAVIHLSMNSENWTLKDGWWYYGEVVDTGKVTQPLMTGVSFDGPNMTNEYQNCTVIIDVIAQAVQAANNGTSALDAQGWPAE